MDANKPGNKLSITYKLMCMNRQTVQSEPLNTVEDILVQPVKTDKGVIVGYVANICFIGDAKKVKIYQGKKSMRDDC